MGELVAGIGGRVGLIGRRVGDEGAVRGGVAELDASGTFDGLLEWA